MPSSVSSRSSIRIAADIGGTFTDIAAFDEDTGRLLFGKSLSTPDALVEGIEAAVVKAEAAFAEANLFLHGSTIAINTLLERTGAETALVITEGFRDIYEIGRINRPDSYNLFFQKHRPLIERARCFEVRERMLAEGEVMTPLDEDQLRAIAAEMAGEGIEAVAILFLHCYRNAVHEQRAREILEEELPGRFISASHELSQEYREFERCSTVAANAYIGPQVRSYLSEIDQHLDGAGFDGSFLVVQSTGGLYEADQAMSDCVRMLESGPAAGVIATRALCEALALENAISFDMGGTTAKSGVIYKGQPLTKGMALIGGYERALPVQIAMMDIFEVGTGGGSIASIDEAGSLHVGPESAGAQPGPVCYGQGGDAPTVTDANLLLGRLGADRFLGGEMRLEVEAARRALAAKVAAPLGMDPTEAADGVLRIAATAMSYAVKGVSTERGLDAGDFTLVAYGGAGPLHASAVAREIGMRRIVVPRAPGYFSALGMLFADLRYDYVRTWFTRLDDVEFDALETIYRDLESQGHEAIRKTSANSGEVHVQRAADMRYVGQEHAVTVELSMDHFADKDREAIKRRFDEVHQLRYGTSAPDERAELVSLRTTVSADMQKPTLARIDSGSETPPDAARGGTRPVYFRGLGGFVDTPTYDRDALLAGNRIVGPALVEEYASTTVVEPDDELVVDDLGNLVISVMGRRT